MLTKQCLLKKMFVKLEKEEEKNVEKKKCLNLREFEGKVMISDTCRNFPRKKNLCARQLMKQMLKSF